MSLNECQSKAYQEILKFCVDPNRNAFILSGAPGTGKSYLINHMVQNLSNDLYAAGSPKSIYFTATTNSAVDNVAQGETIHRTMGLIPDFKTKRLKQVRHPSTADIYIIDEYTFVDWDLATYLGRLPKETKFIFVGDADQLLAVSGLANSLRGRPADYYLDIPMRSKSKDILEVCDILKGWVRNRDLRDLDLEGMADVIAISEQEFEEMIQDPETSWADSRVITHTNKKAVAWNQAIRRANGLPEHFTIGERVSNNKYTILGSAIQVGTDAEFVIDDVQFLGSKPTYMLKGMQYISVTEGQLDLRSSYCSTIYKAQGRSFDTVYVDLSGFLNNITRDALVRSLYVGASRARSKVVFIGNLTDHLWNKI